MILLMIAKYLQFGGEKYAELASKYSCVVLEKESKLNKIKKLFILKGVRKPLELFEIYQLPSLTPRKKIVCVVKLVRHIFAVSILLQLSVPGRRERKKSLNKGGKDAS